MEATRGAANSPPSQNPRCPLLPPSETVLIHTLSYGSIRDVASAVASCRRLSDKFTVTLIRRLVCSNMPSVGAELEKRHSELPLTDDTWRQLLRLVGTHRVPYKETIQWPITGQVIIESTGGVTHNYYQDSALTVERYRLESTKPIATSKRAMMTDIWRCVLLSDDTPVVFSFHEMMLFKGCGGTTSDSPDKSQDKGFKNLCKKRDLVDFRPLANGRFATLTVNGDVEIWSEKDERESDLKKKGGAKKIKGIYAKGLCTTRYITEAQPVCFDTLGDKVITGSSDGTICRWNSKDGTVETLAEIGSGISQIKALSGGAIVFRIAKRRCLRLNNGVTVEMPRSSKIAVRGDGCYSSWGDSDSDNETQLSMFSTKGDLMWSQNSIILEPRPMEGNRTACATEIDDHNSRLVIVSPNGRTQTEVCPSFSGIRQLMSMPGDRLVAQNDQGCVVFSPDVDKLLANANVASSAIQF